MALQTVSLKITVGSDANRQLFEDEIKALDPADFIRKSHYCFDSHCVLIRQQHRLEGQIVMTGTFKTITNGGPYEYSIRLERNG